MIFTFSKMKRGRWQLWGNSTRGPTSVTPKLKTCNVGFAQKQQNPKRWQRWPFQTTNDAQAGKQSFWVTDFNILYNDQFCLQINCVLQRWELCSKAGDGKQAIRCWWKQNGMFEDLYLYKEFIEFFCDFERTVLLEMLRSILIVMEMLMIYSWGDYDID